MYELNRNSGTIWRNDAGDYCQVGRFEDEEQAQTLVSKANLLDDALKDVAQIFTEAGFPADGSEGSMDLGDRLIRIETLARDILKRGAKLG